MLFRAALAAVLLAVMGAAPATAGVFSEFGGVTAPKGIVRAPDGTYWVAEQDRVTQIGAADGKIGRHVVFATPGTRPEKLTMGPLGHIWGTSNKNLFHFDPNAPAGTVATEVAPLTPCATEGIFNADGGVQYTAPTCGKVGAIFMPGLAPPFDIAFAEATVDGAPRAVIAGFGKAWVPIPERDRVVRVKLSGLGAVEAETLVPGGPTGIGPAASTQLLVTTASGTFAEVRGQSPGGSDPATKIFTPPFGTGPLTDVIACTYALSLGTAPVPRGKVVWMGAGAFNSGDLPGGGVPGGIAPAGDGVWLTDTLNNRVLHFVDGPPKVSTADGPKAIVDPIGNDTSVWIEYGMSVGAMRPSAPVTVTGSGAREVGFTLSGLAPGTTYSYRAAASSVRGTGFGEVRTFTTAAVQPPPPPPNPTVTPRLTARIQAARARSRGRMRLTRLRATALLGGETIVIGCASKRLGCLFTRRTVRVRRAGSLDLLATVRRARFRKGAKLTFTVSKPGYRGVTRVVTLR